MAHRFCSRLMLPLLAIGLAAMLGGCVVYPAYPRYGYGYGHGTPYYGGGWHDGDWRR